MRPVTPSAEVPEEAELLRRAREVRSRAYAPYSGFRVGAVVATTEGRTFEGVNLENASYRLTCCAEQAAIAQMVSAGQGREIAAVAVVGDGDAPCTPCGACRQTIFEFGPDAVVYASGDGGQPVVARITDLLPHAFGPRRLAEGRS